MKAEEGQLVRLSDMDIQRPKPQQHVMQGYFFLKEYKYIVIESSCLLSTVGHFSIFSVYGCKSNYKVRSKIRDHTRSIPRSIPPFHTCLKDPFHTYVPYLCSIPLIHTLWCIYIYLKMCSLILHLHAHTWAHKHTWVCTCKNTFTMPKPCDCVGKSVPAAIPTLLCDGRDVLGCC